jgi:hypothetical protein
VLDSCFNMYELPYEDVESRFGAALCSINVEGGLLVGRMISQAHIVKYLRSYFTVLASGWRGKDSIRYHTL